MAPGSEPVGRCTRCGVECVGPSTERAKLLRLRTAHELICPGGNRAGDVWTPLAFALEPLDG